MGEQQDAVFRILTVNLFLSLSLSLIAQAKRPKDGIDHIKWLASEEFNAENSFRSQLSFNYYY
jgi:hypothetical protein